MVDVGKIIQNIPNGRKSGQTNTDPHFHDFYGNSYDVNPNGLAILMKSSIFPFEIQGNFGVLSNRDQYRPGVPTWTRKVAIQCGNIALVVDPSNKSISSNEEIKWIDETSGQKDTGRKCFVFCDDKGVNNIGKVVKSVLICVEKDPQYYYEIHCLISTIVGEDPDPFYLSLTLLLKGEGDWGFVNVFYSIAENHIAGLYDSLIPLSVDNNKKEELVTNIPIQGWVTYMPIQQDLFKIVENKKIPSLNFPNKDNNEEIIDRKEKVCFYNYMKRTGSLNTEIKQRIPNIHQTIEKVKNIIRSDLPTDEIELSWLAIDSINTPPQLVEEVLKFSVQSLKKFEEIKKSNIPTLSGRFIIAYNQWQRFEGKLFNGCIYEIKGTISSGHPDLCICLNACYHYHGYPGSCKVNNHLYICSSNINGTRFKIPSIGTYYAGLWGYSSDTTRCEYTISLVSFCDPYDGPITKV